MLGKNLWNQKKMLVQQRRLAVLSVWRWCKSKTRGGAEATKTRASPSLLVSGGPIIAQTLVQICWRIWFVQKTNIWDLKGSKRGEIIGHKHQSLPPSLGLRWPNHCTDAGLPTFVQICWNQIKFFISGLTRRRSFRLGPTQDTKCLLSRNTVSSTLYDISLDLHIKSS